MTHFKAQDGNQPSKRKTLNTFSYDLEALVRLTRIEHVEPEHGVSTQIRHIKQRQPTPRCTRATEK